MADIDVVKKGPNIWLWILVAVVALAFMTWFMMPGNPAVQG